MQELVYKKLVSTLIDPNIGQKTIDCIIKRLNDEDRTTDDCISRQAVEHGVLGTVNVRNATLKNACIKTDCKWHTCHWSGLYENGCYMLADNSKCISGEKTGFEPYRRMSDE